jgi:hypothetical protein
MGAWKINAHIVAGNTVSFTIPNIWQIVDTINSCVYRAAYVLSVLQEKKGHNKYRVLMVTNL